MTLLPGRTYDAIKSKTKSLGIRTNSVNTDNGGHDATITIPAEEEDVEVRLVVLGDQQLPEIDWKLHESILMFLNDYLANHDGPTYIVNLGDMINATTLGKFDYPLDTPDINKELEDAVKIINEYTAAAGNSKHYFIQGNHEWRIEKAIRSNPQLGVMVDSFPELIDPSHVLEDVLPYVGGVIEFADSMLIEHGIRASKHSGYTAKMNVEDTGMNHICGHTHRLGVHYKRFWEKTVVGLENGCLCVDQSYAHRANWQQGFTYFRFFGREMWFQQVYARNGKFYAEGNEYSG